MTLKQFFQLAGGIIVGIIFYSSPLLAVIKWPLAVISVLLGVGLAFLPLEERPLEKWIFSFFRAIYSPTIFNWQKTTLAPKFYQDEIIPQATQPQDTNLKNLSNSSGVTTALGNLDKAESGFLAKLSSLFGGTAQKQPVQTSPTSASEIPQKPMSTPTEQVVSMSNTSTPISTTTTPSIATTEIKVVQIPETPVVKIPTTSTPVVVEEQTPITTPTQAITNQVSPVVAGNEMISTRQALFSVDAAPPSPPTYPNVVVGQVVDQDRKIIEGAIMEIRDSAGRPIRALRSNKVGHFITVTQLDSGHYEIITEKDNYEFSPVSFEAVGQLIPPILVQGKRLGPVVEMPTIPVKPVYSIN